MLSRLRGLQIYSREAIESPAVDELAQQYIKYSSLHKVYEKNTAAHVLLTPNRLLGQLSPRRRAPLAVFPHFETPATTGVQYLFFAKVQYLFWLKYS